ncbi:hypothetical protein [Paenibacillus sp. FSL H3-0469]|uniref:hypothetical protein n=1 Tax=Paenibacillus sp. FSL H3-0469 TaxID=2954506 RepID=UPI0031012DF1
MVYDHCQIQRSQRFQPILRFGNLTFRNRLLRNKWTVYQTFSQKSRFRPHLLETAQSPH